MEEGRWRFVAASPLRLLVLLVSMRLGTSWNGGVGSGVSYRPLTMRPVQNDGQKICSLRQDPWRHGYCSFPQTSLRHHSEVGTEGVEDMHAFDDAMHAVNQPASMPPQGRESGRNFLYWLATWPTRDLLPETRLPTVSLMLWSALLVYLHSLDKANPFHVEAIGTMPHFVLSGTLGFFLTFRADEGYRRLEEARKVWDGVLNRCRDLIRCGACAGFILGPQGVRRMANLTCAFAMVLEEYVCERASPPDELHELLEPSDIKALERASNSPLTIVELMAQELITLAREDRGGGSLGDSTFFPRFMDSLDGLSHTVTQCERLLKPSVPPVYYGFALRFMSVWLCTLPLALLEENLPAPALIVAQGVITWALFGVWELGVKAQYPFKAGAVNMRNLWKSLIVEAKDSLYVARLQQKEGSSKRHSVQGERRPIMSTARSAGLPAHASFGGLGTTPGRKAPVLSHVLGSPTHPAGRLDSFTTGSLSFSFGSSDHSFNNPALKGSMRCQPTVRTSRPRGAPGAGLKAATSSFSLSSVPAPPTMVKSMSLPVGEFPRRSFVCRLDEFSQKTGLPRVTSSSAIAPLQNSPPPKAPKPTPPSRKRPRYPRGHTEDVKASGNNSGTIITATSTSLSAPTTPAFAPQPMPPLPPACTMSASTQMPGYAAPPAFGPTGGLPSVNDDDDESEILSYLISSDGFESLVSSLQDHNDSPMSPPRQLPRPAVAVPGVASDVHAHHHAHVHAAQNAGLCTQMDGLGVYGSPDIPRAKPAFTTSPFERVRLDCDDTPGAFSLREINERINSPGLLRSRTNSLDSARLPSAAASTSICSFRPIDPQGDVLHAFPMVVPPVEEFRHEEQVPCDLSEDEVGIEIDDEDDQDPLSGSTVEMLFNAFSEAEAAHAAQQQQAHAHAHTHTLTYAHTHSGVPPAAAGACVHPAAGGHAHAASYPPTSMSVLLDTTGCGLGPVEQLRSFSPSILFSGDVPEHTMTL